MLGYEANAFVEELAIVSFEGRLSFKSQDLLGRYIAKETMLQIKQKNILIFTNGTLGLTPITNYMIPLNY